MGIFLIAKDNIKKKKGNTFILFLLISLAMLFLYVGTSVLSNMGKVIERRNEAINGADYFLFTKSIYPEKIENILNEQENIIFVESEKTVHIPDVKFYKEKKAETGEAANHLEFLFLDRAANRELSKIGLIDEGNEWKENSIILSYYMKVGMGYKTGDTIYLEFDNTTDSFEVYGFTEDIFFSTPTNMPAEKCYISSKYMQQYIKEGKAEGTIFRAELKNTINMGEYEKDINKILYEKIEDFRLLNNLSVNYEDMKYGTSVSANIFMGILTIFAILLIFISLIIVQFSINNSIEMNMRSIGMLKASGYTSGQMTASIIVEFTMISIAAICAGLLASSSASAAIGGMLSASIGMSWEMGFDMVSAVFSTAFILFLVLLMVILCSRKFRITPLEALRNGVNTHHFRKDPIHLDEGILQVDCAVGIKSILYNKRKSIGVCLIIIVLTFCANIAVCIYQNFALRDERLLEVTGFEVSDIRIVAADNDMQTLMDVKREVSDISGIVLVLEHTAVDAVCRKGEKEAGINIDVYDHADGLQVDNVVEGRRPRYENEIMLTTVISDRLGVSVGDVIYLEMNGMSRDYLLVGKNQGVNNLGRKGIMTKDGISRLISDTIVPELYIYTDDSIDSDTMINILKNMWPDEKILIANVRDYVSTSLAPIATVMKILCEVMLTVVIFVIALILVLLVKMQLIREQRQLGIYKALGYTSLRLIVQTLMSYIPVVFTGALVGCILSWFFAKPVFLLCLTVFGIKKSGMEIQIMYMIGAAAAIIVWAALITLICSARIRKIVPWKMIQES